MSIFYYAFNKIECALNLGFESISHLVRLNAKGTFLWECVCLRVCVFTFDDQITFDLEAKQSFAIIFSIWLKFLAKKNLRETVWGGRLVKMSLPHHTESCKCNG